MWMMGCSSDVSESFTRRVRSHIPRPSTILNPSPYMSRRGDHLVLNHHNHLVSAAEQSKRDFDEEEPALVSSRWNPTPEQIQTLEELYRRGTRTPSADQIIHITAQLRRFGRIEGKNVFYWFQNHKARERSKRRRRSENIIDDHQDLPQTTLQESQGASRTSHEASEEAAKNNIYWGFSTITATPTEEESVSMQNAERSEGIQYDHQVQQNTWFMNRYPTWQMIPSSSSSSSSSSSCSSSTRPIFTMVTEDLNLLLNNQKQAESHTLELFPIQKGDKNGENMDDLKGKSVCNEESCGSSPKQFFEFL